jgi:hypothetical protein
VAARAELERAVRRGDGRAQGSGRRVGRRGRGEQGRQAVARRLGVVVHDPHPVRIPVGPRELDGPREAARRAQVLRQALVRDPLVGEDGQLLGPVGRRVVDDDDPGDGMRLVEQACRHSASRPLRL